MKQKTILYWSLSAVLYLGVVVGGYSVYASLNPDSGSSHTAGEGADHWNAEPGHAEAADSHDDADHDASGHGGMEDGHKHETDHSAHGTPSASEISVTVGYKDDIIAVELKDKENKAPRLEVNHEKVMHLIVVSVDLEDYYHLHPEDKGNGLFEQRFRLKDKSYKVFVDIKPADLDYAISPVGLQAGESHTHHGDNRLQADTEFVRTVDGKTVELSIDSLTAKQPTTLTFDSKDGKPEPYLGALGHVVILDEAGEQFIHVHPASDDSTVFNTQFNKPGLYKLWGEFKFGDQVHVYPFVIEVE